MHRICLYSNTRSEWGPGDNLIKQTGSSKDWLIYKSQDWRESSFPFSECEK
jgi:hypothetical protein